MTDIKMMLEKWGRYQKALGSTANTGWNKTCPYIKPRGSEWPDEEEDEKLIEFEADDEIKLMDLALLKLKGVSPGKFEIVTCHYIGLKTYAEIAEKINGHRRAHRIGGVATENSVKDTMYKIRLQLKEWVLENE